MRHGPSFRPEMVAFNLRLSLHAVDAAGGFAKMMEDAAVRPGQGDCTRDLSRRCRSRSHGGYVFFFELAQQAEPQPHGLASKQGDPIN